MVTLLTIHPLSFLLETNGPFKFFSNRIHIGDKIVPIS